ncbi:MAG: S24 family peptidase [Thioalkalispiraceae bacterium]|jgi:SOS-response transcriptional repressor LexA
MSHPESRMAPSEMMSGCSSTEPFALQVVDDSMEPEFMKGAIIVIDAQGHVQSGSYVIAEIETGYIFRRLFIEEGGHILRAVKEGHDDIELTGLEQIKGVITQQAAPTGKRKDRVHYYPNGERRQKN